MRSASSPRSWQLCATSVRRQTLLLRQGLPQNTNSLTQSCLYMCVYTPALPVTLRVAGGWVRDKLLGRESKDIDIALDALQGREFAERVNEYLASTGAPTSGVGVIHANPEQSKHLETATLRVHGTWLDLVHLRSETYAEGSRIPDAVSFGTPEQDAQRRDLTFNALFYNLHSRCVEDHLGGAGLADLRAGIARTPLPPLQTLLDDPLRALRAVRLATRLGFSLAADLQEAAASPQVHAALRAKVSRERVGVELDGMLRGPHPVASLRTLCRLGLAPAVFDGPSGVMAALPHDWPWACMQSVDTTIAVLAAMQPPALPAPTEAAAATGAEAGDGGIVPLIGDHTRSLWHSLSDDPRKWALLAGFLAPLRRVQHVPPTQPGGKGGAKPQALVALLIREALKLRTKDVEQVSRILDASDAFAALYASSASNGGEAGSSKALPSRSQLGRMLRSAKHQWRVAAAIGAVTCRAQGVMTLTPDGTLEEQGTALAALAACRDGQQEAQGLASGGQDDITGGDAHAARGRLPESLLPATVLCDTTVARCEALGLDGCWDWKPLLTGGDVQQALGMTKPGPALGQWLDALLTWELDNAGGTKEQALKWLSQARAAGPSAQ